MRHPRSCDASFPCLTEHPLATGLYTTGAGQACAMRVTELGPSLAMLRRVPQELLLEILELLPVEQSLFDPHNKAIHRLHLFEEMPFFTC